MTCRHRAGDPNCSTKNPEAMAAQARKDYARWVGGPAGQVTTRVVEKVVEKVIVPPPPDNSKYEVIRHREVHGYLAVQVRYESCDNCAFDNNKLMIFEDVNTEDLVNWRVIDPHFREDDRGDLRHAPAPILRMPATEKSWEAVEAIIEVFRVQRGQTKEQDSAVD